MDERQDAEQGNNVAVELASAGPKALDILAKPQQFNCRRFCQLWWPFLENSKGQTDGGKKGQKEPQALKEPMLGQRSLLAMLVKNHSGKTTPSGPFKGHLV